MPQCMKKVLGNFNAVASQNYLYWFSKTTNVTLLCGSEFLLTFALYSLKVIFIYNSVIYLTALLQIECVFQAVVNQVVTE